jgi:hypothetical protein
LKSLASELASIQGGRNVPRPNPYPPPPFISTVCIRLQLAFSLHSCALQTDRHGQAQSNSMNTKRYHAAEDLGEAPQGGISSNPKNSGVQNSGTHSCLCCVKEEPAWRVAHMWRTLSHNIQSDRYTTSDHSIQTILV